MQTDQIIAAGARRRTMLQADSYGLTSLATTSERVLEVMNNLTSLYEVALRDLLGTA